MYLLLHSQLLLSSTPMLLLLLLLLSSIPMLLPLWLQQWLLLLCHTLTLWLMLPITQAVSTVLGLLFHVLRTTRIRHRYYTQDYTGQHWKNNTTNNTNIKLQHDKIATQHSIYQYIIERLQHYNILTIQNCKITRLQHINTTRLQDYKITSLQPGNREEKNTKDCRIDKVILS